MNKDSLAFLGMLQANDSMFPIGQFTLSNGLETFVLEERLSCDKDLSSYIQSYLSICSYNDVLIFLLAYTEDIKKLDEIAYATKAPFEVRSGGSKLALRFTKMWKEIGAMEYPLLMNYGEMLENGQARGVYAISVALYARDLGLAKEEAVKVFLYSQLSAMVTNAVKTVPLSQTKGQAVLNRALSKIDKVVEKAMKLTIEDIGAGGCMFDIECMRHEFLYSRQYMS
ncbi:MAG: hypothetical protein K6A23_07645 [Butyrivibrio sp.]|nr:hypothetical protein [Butyrivibrio sp.]